MIALGFLASQEVKDARVGNLGLRDRKLLPETAAMELIYGLERLALRWIQQYITAFGGDPSKVTM